MSYQKFLKKIVKMESETLEKMRLTVILSISLVFGVILQQMVFNDGTDILANKTVNAKKIDASTVQVILADQTQGDSSQNTASKQKITKENKVIPSKTPAVVSDSLFLTSSPNPNFLPIRNYGVPDININAKSAIVVSSDGKILYKKNIDKKLPIASLTKVMTGIIVLENLDPEEIVTVDKKAIDTEGIAGRFKINERIKVKDLAKIMLVVSSNDAAEAFLEHFKSKGIDMIDLMNKKARELKLSSTHFSNPIGFDDPENYSTARDYANLILYSLKNEKLWEILSTKDEIVKSIYPGVLDRRVISSNKLIFKNIWGILGGKTGYTPDAGGCLMIAFEVTGQNSRPNKKLISVVLGASDTQARFDETEKLINWIRKAYIF